jgi:rhodanese-related sulfurtransferase
MNPRVQISVLLLILGGFLAFIPRKQVDRFVVKPAWMAGWAVTDTATFTVDEVARMINDETPGITLIDVRSAGEFRYCSLPGSLNIPIQNLTNAEHMLLLKRTTGKNIFYSNDDETSVAALTFATGMRYQNCYRMKGGLNSWFEVIMNASFSGERITAKENALFSNRFDAKNIFTQYNSLPDSLKVNLFASRQVERAKLDGGFE